MLALILCALGVVLFVKLIPWLRKYWMISSLPGPSGLPFIGVVSEMAGGGNDGMDFLRRQARALRKQGKNVMTINIAGKIITAPLNGETVQPILESETEITKGVDYAFNEPWIGGGLIMSTGDKWFTHRRLITPTFHISRTDGYIEVMNRHTKILMDIFEEALESSPKICERVRLCALDVICEVAMGKELDSQRNPRQPYVRALEEFNAMGWKYTMTPSMWILWYPYYKAKYDSLVETLTGFTKKVLAERMQAIESGDCDGGDGERVQRKIFIDMLLELRESDQFTMEDVRKEVDTFMFGGHDTTSATTCWAMWCLATNPDCQQRAYEEIHAIFGTSDRDCTAEDFKNMPYLDRCIKETMRKWPTIPAVLRNLQNDFTIGGHVVPKDTEVMICPMILHDNDQVYEDVNRFDPDRFLPENAAMRHALDFIPFSAGPRNCIVPNGLLEGQKFAILEVKVILSWVIRKFVLSSRKGMLEVQEAHEVVLRPAQEFPIIFTPRV